MDAGAASSAGPAFRDHEDLLELLYLCPVALVRIDPYGAIVLMNPQGTQLLMPMSQDGNLENLFDLFEPVAPEVREMARRFTPPAGRICEEHRVAVPRRNDPGASTILSLTLHKIDAEILVAVIADATASATRERNIRLSEERLHAVLDGMNEYAICTLDQRGTITSWNRSSERLDGFRSDEVMGRHVDMLAPATGHAISSFAKHIESARRNGWREFEAWRVRKDGSRYWAHCTISTLRKSTEETMLGFSLITRDTTELRRTEDNLRLLASTDPLTGALNRRAFFEVAKREEARAARFREPLTLLLMDVDEFKIVNDTHGHDAGDAVLQRFVAECRGEIRSSDVLARFGGDEFAILLTGATLENGGNEIADRIRSKVARMRVAVGGIDVAVTVSVGVAEASQGEATIEDLLRIADQRMYADKARREAAVGRAGATF